MTESMIEMKNVTKTFRIHKRSNGFLSTISGILKPKYEYKKAVDGLSIQIKEGEMVGFIGPNGSGKSTSVKMLSGILYPDSGEICVGGYNPYKQRKDYVSNIGVVFGQKTQLTWDLPVIESYDLLKHIYRIPEKTYKNNLERYMELLDMKDFLEQPVRQLSLGQRMRADIVAALLHSPKILFFDEPTIGVDVVGKEKIREFVKTLNQTDHITMLFTTHDMQDIEKTCNRLIIIDKGKSIYDGSMTKMRQQFGTTRQLDIEFVNPCDISPIDHITIEDVREFHGRKKRFLFEQSQIDMNEFMKQIFNQYQVKDLSINEPEIEEIIRNIYQGRVPNL